MRLLRESLVPTALFNLSDPEARSRYHARIHVDIADIPSAHRRGLQVVSHTIFWLLGLLGLLMQGRLTARERGKALRRFLESLGGLWIKPGQILATRRDILPVEFCEELSALQERMTGFPPAEAVRIIEEELGGPISHFFEEFQMQPFAAASVGQLHKATLRGQQMTIAIKVQRPNLEASFIQDMKFIRRFVRLIEGFGYMKHIRWTEMADELNKILTEEFDFRYEASNIERMRKTLRKSRIYAPELIPQYCTKRIMVMEFVSGVSWLTTLPPSGSPPNACTNG